MNGMDDIYIQSVAYRLIFQYGAASARTFGEFTKKNTIRTLIIIRKIKKHQNLGKFGAPATKPTKKNRHKSNKNFLTEEQFYACKKILNGFEPLIDFCIYRQGR